MDRIPTLRVLLIVTFRPEFEPPWIGRPYVTALTLNRLGEREIAAMIDGVTGNKPLPANVRQDIIERTDGIPLFVEEMTKAVLEAESESEAEQTAAAVPSRGSSGPGKSPRLPDGPARPARPRKGSGANRRCHWAGVLARAVGRGGAQARGGLHSALDRLVAAGLLFRQGVPPHASYLFKHASVRTPPMGHYCASRAERFTLALPRP